MERTPPTPASVIKACGTTEATSTSLTTPITANINSNHRTQIAKLLKPFEFDTQRPEEQQPLVMDSETVTFLSRTSREISYQVITLKLRRFWHHRDLCSIVEK
jgi:hypothetical protein